MSFHLKHKDEAAMILVRHRTCHSHVTGSSPGSADKLLTQWNSLLNNTVDAESVNTFKTRLDKYWSHQPLLYDFKTKTAGTGDRPKYDIEV